MDTATARLQVIDAFDPETGGYSNQIPRVYNDFIDGLAWVGMCWGASLKVKDYVVAELCERYCTVLLEVGKDARNFAPTQVKPDWIKSTTYQNLWYTVKPQAFAGPAGLEFAIQCGANIKTPFNPGPQARLMVAMGSAFGLASKYFEWPRTYINSMWTAYLILKKKPASSMLWSCEENPFFSYIAGKKCSVEYPSTTRFLQSKETSGKNVVPFKDAKPSAWAFRRDPFKKYSGEGELESDSYTPIAQLVGDYLQQTLD